MYVAQFCKLLVALAYCLAMLLSTGCAVAPKDSQRSPLAGLLSGSPSKNKEETKPAGPVVYVHVIPEMGRPRRIDLPFTQGATVQQALTESKALKRFQNVKIEIIRTDKQTGQRVKMNAKYLIGKRRIAISDDYALYPGDYIVVQEDTKTQLDQFLDPVAKLLGQQ